MLCRTIILSNLNKLKVNSSKYRFISFTKFFFCFGYSILYCLHQQFRGFWFSALSTGYLITVFGLSFPVERIVFSLFFRNLYVLMDIDALYCLNLAIPCFPHLYYFTQVGFSKPTRKDTNCLILIYHSISFKNYSDESWQACHQEKHVHIHRCFE